MLSITAAAQDKLAEVLDNDHYLRLSAVRGPHGCVHRWSLDEDRYADPSDVVHTVGRIRVVHEPTLAEALDGATIDYREDSTGAGFTIAAPNGRRHSPGHGECGHR